MIEIALATILNTNTPVLSTIEIESTPHSLSSSVRISSPSSSLSSQHFSAPSISKPSTFNIGRTSTPSTEIARSYGSSSSSRSSYSSRPSFSSSSYSRPSAPTISRPTVNLNSYSVARPSTSSVSISPVEKTKILQNTPRSDSGAIKLNTFAAPKTTTTVRSPQTTRTPARVAVPSRPVIRTPQRVVTQNHYYGNGQQAPVIIHDSGSSVFSNPWFWMSMQNQRQPQTVIQQYPAPVVQQAPAGEVIPQPSSVLTSSTGAPVVVRRDSGSGAITTIALIVLIVTVIVMGIALLKRRR